MQTNCPRCNMFLAPGAQVCPNCQLNLVTYAYQQQQQQYGYQAPVIDPPENRKEKLYRKILIGICIAMFANFLIEYLPVWFDGMMVYTLMKPLRYLNTIASAGLPLFVALILPRKNSVRVLFIVLASIYAAAALFSFVYYEWFYYTGWSEDLGGY